jgi:hypothetical protein
MWCCWRDLTWIGRRVTVVVGARCGSCWWLIEKVRLLLLMVMGKWMFFFYLLFTRGHMFFVFSKRKINLQCAIKCLGMKNKCFFVFAYWQLGCSYCGKRGASFFFLCLWERGSPYFIGFSFVIFNGSFEIPHPFFYMVQPPIYKKNKFVIFLLITWSLSKLGDQATQNHFGPSFYLHFSLIVQIFFLFLMYLVFICILIFLKKTILTLTQ